MSDKVVTLLTDVVILMFINSVGMALQSLLFHIFYTQSKHANVYNVVLICQILFSVMHIIMMSLYLKISLDLKSSTTHTLPDVLNFCTIVFDVGMVFVAFHIILITVILSYVVLRMGVNIVMRFIFSLPIFVFGLLFAVANAIYLIRLRKDI